MKLVQALVISALLGVLIVTSQLHAQSEKAIVFSAEDIHNWTQESFVEQTRYSLNDDYSAPSPNTQVLSAEARGQASALYHEQTIDLTQTPYLQWHWRVDKKLTITNAYQKDQDDYPARIYVVIKEGIFPWQVRSLNYVWANHRPDKDFWPNPYTDRAAMIPLRSDKDQLHRWYAEKVDIAKDFKRIFGRAITEIHAIAIMTDADNTGGHALAHYGELRFTAK
jgi:Protein of unknown function (DUF3047)